MKNVLVLYRELAGYTVTCLGHLSSHHNVSVDVVAYPVNPEAPFQFQLNRNIVLHDRTKMTDEDFEKLLLSKSYDLVFCGGWIDKSYLKLVRSARNIPRVVAFDKQWMGSMRDWLAACYLRIKVRPLFDFAFVAGKEQTEFARKMGFARDTIFEGLYTSDVEAYSDLFRQRTLHPQTEGKRRMWYAGRYIGQKAFNDLFVVFAELADGPLKDWELHAVGTGALWDQRIEHPSIVHHGFVQPAELIHLIGNGELFVLPSLFEPWGVVVQEFAAAGFPLILSDKVGARTSFLEENVNGIVFKAGDRNELSTALIDMAARSANELKAMGEVSHKLALQITPETWSQCILRMITQKIR